MDKQKDKKKLLMTSFIIFIMFGSVLGYALIYVDNNDKTQTINYNNYDFVKNGDFWITYINDQPFLFEYLPKEVENIDFNAFAINKDKVYIAYNPLDLKQINAISFNKISAVLTAFSIQPIKACIINKCENLPLVNCDDKYPVIYFKNSSETKIYTNKNCIILEGNPNMAVDRLNFAFLGVIK
ncbi:MAG: hypothetical protein AABY07_06470 [Nanoarchaeota archaeon]